VCSTLQLHTTHADGPSNTGSCVVIGDLGAAHCRSAKQTIVTKISTEGELVALSDSANQGLFLRNLLILQGYDMPALIVYHDNMSCMNNMSVPSHEDDRVESAQGTSTYGIFG
jgi:hypothetical protein